MNIPEIFLKGASSVKKDPQAFKLACSQLASVEGVHSDSRGQLLAASVAPVGKANTGLVETGWRGLAELLGMISPSSKKLIVPAGVSPEEHKKAVLEYWVKSGYYPSSRKDGKGGSSALGNDSTSGEAMVLIGVRAFGRSDSGKQLNSSIALAEQRLKALRERTAPETKPATVKATKIILID